MERIRLLSGYFRGGGHDRQDSGRASGMTELWKWMVDHRWELLAGITVAVAGCLYVCLFSYATSPLYPRYFYGDAAEFLTIGKAWALGKIPYRDLFDHKGPIIYFINRLGFMMTGTKTGVFFIQCIFMAITANVLLGIGKLRSKSNTYGVILVVICLLILRGNYGEGNYVDEYCLTLVAISVYCQLKWFDGRNGQHLPYLAVFYGAAFGFCAMMRVTNAILICSGVLVIAIALLLTGKYKNLFQNAVGFVSGFALVVIPFGIYFGLHQCFADFIYSVFTFNFEYQTGAGRWIDHASADDLKNFASVFISYFCGLAAALLALRRRAYAISLWMLISFALETYLFLGGFLFGQYAQVCLPQVAVLLNEVYLLRFEEEEGIIKAMLLAGLMISCYMSLVQRVPGFINVYRDNHAEEFHYGAYESLLAQIPEEELDSFVAYGDNRFKGIYLMFDLMPSYKYYAIQEWKASFSDHIKRETHETFMDGDAKWILTAGSTSVIQDVLDQRYEVYDTVEDYTLFRLVQ